jgi:hypothetical protein
MLCRIKTKNSVIEICKAHSDHIFAILIFFHAEIAAVYSYDLAEQERKKISLKNIITVLKKASARTSFSQSIAPVIYRLRRKSIKKGRGILKKR